MENIIDQKKMDKVVEFNEKVNKFVKQMDEASQKANELCRELAKLRKELSLGK